MGLPQAVSSGDHHASLIWKPLRPIDRRLGIKIDEETPNAILDLEKSNLKLGFIKSSTDCAPLVIAKRERLLRRRGVLNVTLDPQSKLEDPARQRSIRPNSRRPHARRQPIRSETSASVPNRRS